MPTTGQRLRELRFSLGYSADEFAKLLGVGRSSLYRYENSEGSGLPITTAVALSEQFNISLDWLAGMSDQKYRIKYSFGEIYDSLTDSGKKAVYDYAMYIKMKEKEGDE
jgi:transcriptional regulator with XRE-family HTH domain